ncbi:MAG: ABC transporter ATP-binding protein [Balneolaceae bacterium]|nr:ABC transporter ATP-binding protein [Balneolaceae bacterium]
MFVELRHLQHQYPGSQTTLSFPDTEFAEGARHLLLGPSGSGKSTVLHMLAGLLRPTSGEIWVDSHNLAKMNDRALDRFRGERMGIIFQQHHLIGVLSVEDNLALASTMVGERASKKRIDHLLEALDMSSERRKRPSQLSEGQRQRVSIARALMNEPSLLLADEPTSALDDERAMQFMGLLSEVSESEQTTLVVATHDARIVPHFDHVTRLEEKL